MHERYANFYTDFAFKNQAEIAMFSPEERRDYRESQKDFWDLYAVTETAENKGRAEGRAEGRSEEKFAIAKNLKAMGMTIEQISQATGLSNEEIASM